MNALVFNGSPHPDGDTARLIRALIENLPGEHVTVNAYGSRISPCVDCRACMIREGCAIDDDMTEVYARIQQADAIVIASPVYFSELSGPLLSIMSRLQSFYCARRFLGTEPIIKSKRGGVLLAAGGDGSPARAFETAKGLLRHMGVREIHPAIISSPTDKRPAADDSDALAMARALGTWLVRMDGDVLAMDHTRAHPAQMPEEAVRKTSDGATIPDRAQPSDHLPADRASDSKQAQTQSGAAEPMFVILPVDKGIREEVNRFIRTRWYATDMALRGKLIDLSNAAGFAAYEGRILVGLITYALSDGECEILSLDSLHPGKGIGTVLMRRVIERAHAEGASRVVLITTNDHTDVLRFYQRMGFDLVGLHRNALRTSRKLKPSIPLVGEHGIPLRHELELVLSLEGEIVCAKGALTDPEVATLLAASMYKPTPARIAARAEEYANNPEVRAWCLREVGAMVGLIVVDAADPARPVVRALAVDEKARGRGIGRTLVRRAALALSPGTLIAETDDDAVGFYRKAGFSIESLGEVYPGVRRYRCALPPPERRGPRVERLTPGDEAWADQTADILRAAFPHCYADDAIQEVMECLEYGRVALVAVEDGRVVGFAGARPHYDGNAWELHPLAVEAASRGRGIGRLLVEALEDIASDRGGYVMYLGTDDEFFKTSLSEGDLFEDTLVKLAHIENRADHPYTFYQKLGYRIVGALPDANGPHKPDIWMAKRIVRGKDDHADRQS